jgi:Tfp pilus assembly protein PilX
MTRNNERGIALVITLFLMASLSALAVSLMFLSQTETASSRNYRTMSQARYAGEAGVHKAINYLINSYSAPGTFSSYDISQTPVTCVSGCTNVKTAGQRCDPSTPSTASASGCVILSTLTGVASNYPDSAVRTAFATAGTGTLAVNSSGTITNAALGTVTYNSAAILMSMRTINSYGGSSGVLQTWQIVSDGTAGAQSATVEVTGSLERTIADAQTFAVFATGTGCGAISLSGNVATASYDSSVSTTTTNSGGNVGTNGNLDIQGHVDVHGSLSTPRTGVGSCTDSATGVTALTETGAATVDNNALTQLPQALSFPAPATPISSPASTWGWPPTTTMAASAATCATINLQAPGKITCTYASGKATIDFIDPASQPTVLLGNITGNWVLNGGSYAINAIGAGSNTSISVGTSTLGNSTAVVNLAGRATATSTTQDMTNPFNTNGQAVVNTSMDPSRLQVLYAGAGSIDMTGGSSACMMLYAPNATVTTHGNSDIFGSLLAAQVTSAGTPRFVYDRHLQATFKVLGNYAMTSFSWKKY